jgi:hypothetical protein
MSARSRYVTLIGCPLGIHDPECNVFQGLALFFPRLYLCYFPRAPSKQNRLDLAESCATIAPIAGRP